MEHLLLDHAGVILHISDTIGYQSNGNPLVDNGTLAYAAILVSRVVEVASIPANVTAMRYCYTNGQFVLNPHYIDPTPSVGGAVSEAFSILHGDTEVK
ncbi:MAG: hypothetical protein RSD95_14390 [Clostridia bacterium]